MRRDYVEECIFSVLGSEGLVLGTEKRVFGLKYFIPVSSRKVIDQMVTDIAYGIDMWSEASGEINIPNPLKTELREVKQKSKQELDSVVEAFEKERKLLHAEIRSLRMQLQRALDDKQ